MLAQVVSDPSAPVVIPGLSPGLQFLLAMATMLVPLLVAVLKARQNGRVADSVVAGVESGATDAVALAKTLLERAQRGEHVSEADLAAIGARFKTGIQRVAQLDGTERLLAPRVERVTTALDAEALRRKLTETPPGGTPTTNGGPTP